MLCSAHHHRIARANVTSTTSSSSSSSRVDVPVTRKTTVVVRPRGRLGRVSTRASGDDGNGRGQDVQNDWDGAWRAFKRDFVGEDAKMPGDYVETKFKSKRYVWNFARRRRRRLFLARVRTHARTYIYILTLARPGTSFLRLARRRSPDADAKQQIYDDEDRVLNFATSNSFSVAGVIGVVVLLFLFVVVIGPPPSDGRCSLPWCG